LQETTTRPGRRMTSKRSRNLGGNADRNVSVETENGWMAHLLRHSTELPRLQMCSPFEIVSGWFQAYAFVVHGHCVCPIHHESFEFCKRRRVCASSSHFAPHQKAAVMVESREERFVIERQEHIIMARSPLLCLESKRVRTKLGFTRTREDAPKTGERRREAAREEGVTRSRDGRGNCIANAHSRLANWRDLLGEEDG